MSYLKLIGPHVEKDREQEWKNGFWYRDVCQIYIQNNQGRLRRLTYQHLVEKFPHKPADYSGKGKVYAIHLPYTNVIQSTDPAIVEVSFTDLKYEIKAAKMLFPEESQVFIVMHLVSFKDFNVDLLCEYCDAMPKNMKLAIEHIPSDDF